MSEHIKAINSFFSTALKPEVDLLVEQLMLSDRQTDIFYRFYIRKQDRNFIADELGMSSDSVAKELKKVRKKIVKALGY